jgi:hypothetical protein
MFSKISLFFEDSFLILLLSDASRKISVQNRRSYSGEVGFLGILEDKQQGQVWGRVSWVLFETDVRYTPVLRAYGVAGENTDLAR